MTATAEKSFKDIAKRAKAKANTVLYVKHSGAPQQYPTKDGTETAYDGDYVVQVGEREIVETIPPNRDKGIEGKTVTHKAPVLEVMKAQDFEALYEV
jgi:hypothetical protein